MKKRSQSQKLPKVCVWQGGMLETAFLLLSRKVLILLSVVHEMLLGQDPSLPHSFSLPDTSSHFPSHS